jgi:hypothetical protein
MTLIKLSNDRYINFDNVTEISPVPVSEWTGAKPGTLRIDFVGLVDQDHGYTWIEGDEAEALRTWLDRTSINVASIR